VLGDLGLVVRGGLRGNRPCDGRRDGQSGVVLDDRGNVLRARREVIESGGLIESGRRAGTGVKFKFGGLVKESRQGRSRSVDARG
jgi:hypothetical protein